MLLTVVIFIISFIHIGIPDLLLIINIMMAATVTTVISQRAVLSVLCMVLQT